MIVNPSIKLMNNVLKLNILCFKQVVQILAKKLFIFQTLLLTY